MHKEFRATLKDTHVGNKNTNKFFSFFLFLLIFIILFAGTVLFAYNYYNSQISSPLSKTNEAYTIEIVPGDTFLNVVNRMKENQVISSTLPIQIYLRVNNISPVVQAGEYNLQNTISLPDIIAAFETAKFKPGIRVTFKEGITSKQMLEILEGTYSLSSSFVPNDFRSIVENPSLYTFQPKIQEFFSIHKPSFANLEGYLYPDTYEFAQEATALGIIETMLLNFISKVENSVNLANLELNQTNIENIHQAVILGSIIDKEASAWDDRSEIAGVFHNRLRIGMLLQSDATVNFITGRNDAGVSLADTQIDNPYNTYKYVGLPPGPINNPRINSIMSALYPKITNYLFFYHTPNGQTFLNETFENHQSGVCRDLGC